MVGWLHTLMLMSSPMSIELKFIGAHPNAAAFIRIADGNVNSFCVFKEEFQYFIQ